MNMHLISTNQRLTRKKAIQFLKGKACHSSTRLVETLDAMLRILFKSEGKPIIGPYEGSLALHFNGKVPSEEVYEYPVLQIGKDGIPRVYSLMHRPDQPPWTYFVETMEDNTWVGKKLY